MSSKYPEGQPSLKPSSSIAPPRAPPASASMRPSPPKQMSTIPEASIKPAALMRATPSQRPLPVSMAPQRYDEEEEDDDEDHTDFSTASIAPAAYQSSMASISPSAYPSTSIMPSINPSMKPSDFPVSSSQGSIRPPAPMRPQGSIRPPSDASIRPPVTSRFPDQKTMLQSRDQQSIRPAATMLQRRDVSMRPPAMGGSMRPAQSMVQGRNLTPITAGSGLSAAQVMKSTRPISLAPPQVKSILVRPEDIQMASQQVGFTMLLGRDREQQKEWYVICLHLPVIYTPLPFYPHFLRPYIHSTHML